VDKGAIIVGRPTVNPRFVTVEGPESMVRSITRVPIASFPQKKVSLSDTVLKADLNAGQNPFIRLEPQQVELHFPVEALSEKVIYGVPVRLKGFPAKRKYSAEPDSLDITVQGPASVIARVERSDITAAVPYGSFLQRSEGSGDAVHPDIRYPKGIIGIIPSQETVRVAPKQQTPAP
jgi:YbbR domain-containing protein